MGKKLNTYVTVGGVVYGPTDDVPKDVVKLITAEGVWEGGADKEPEFEAPKPPTIPEILKEVGDDKEKAAAALAQEQAGDKPRPSLVEKLEAIVSV